MSPAFAVCFVNLLEDAPNVIFERPAGIVGFEAPVIADPPDVIADAIRLPVCPLEFLACDLLAQPNRLDHRGVAEAPTSDVVDLRDPGRLKELVERPDEILAVDGIPHLLALVAKDLVRAACHDATHDVGEEAMQFRRGVVGARQRTSAKTCGPHAEVASVLLHKHVRGDLRRTEEAVEAIVDRHVLPDAVPVRVPRLDLPPRLELDEVKTNAASGALSRVASRTFNVPTALMSKSVNGSRAAQSCEGCAAVCMTSSIARP